MKGVDPDNNSATTLHRKFANLWAIEQGNCESWHKGWETSGDLHSAQGPRFY